MEEMTGSDESSEQDEASSKASGKEVFGFLGLIEQGRLKEILKSVARAGRRVEMSGWLRAEECKGRQRAEERQLALVLMTPEAAIEPRVAGFTGFDRFVSAEMSENQWDLRDILDRYEHLPMLHKDSRRPLRHKHAK
ncbi:hypothetical protein M5K25_006611 [Dendrobium thyrsiflorum]|uniref:Uncharacterized protein n=1 Tax=Dendrobium thyrsiflorum TaxID=117978 RepID=A0ABD0VDA0_DENTH